ncbi:MAG: FAD-dependent thymidylate synthase [Clostridia bacterium]|nr:FAD-dependent thymidylate synthase [Clostridia bacterium]
MKIELIGGYEKNELETRIQKVATAGKLSRFPGNVFEVLESCNNYEKNLNLIKRIIGMGHKSIIEHDYLVFAICDVTPIIEQTIIGNRLTSFTIKSRREVDFRTAGFYVPEFRNKDLSLHTKNEELKEKYISHMKYLFNTYGELVDNGINVEDARFILPYSFHSNIIMGLNGRELEKMVVSFLYGPLSKISELKEFGEQLLSIIKDSVPYLENSIESYNISSNNPFEYMETISKRPEIKIADKPTLISYTQNPDDVIIKSSIMYHFQCSENEASEILINSEKKDPHYKAKCMDIILHKEERRELEQVNFTFQIPISLSILTHLTRHRMHSLLVPEFLPIWNFENIVVPATIRAKNNLEKLFLDSHKENIKVFEEFKNMNVAEEDLIYFYLGCQMLNVITTMNGRTLQWILHLRCCNKAQWQIRAIAKEIAKQVSMVSPLLGKGLGPTCITDMVCYEGKECCGLINTLLKNKNDDKN